MGEILPFTPRPRPPEPASHDDPSDTALRAQIERGAQVALDLADHLIGILDQVDGDADLEDGADAEPSLAAPENEGSQATWTRGTDQDREADEAEAELPDLILTPWPLPWSGRANVIAVAGIALLDLIERRG